MTFMAKKPKPIVVPVVIGEHGMVFSEDQRTNERLRAQFVAAAKSWPKGPAELELRPYEETRRGRANRFYRGVILKLMSVDSGYTPDELHELFKVRHNHKLVVDPESGEEIRIGQSTAKLTVSEFSDYLERVMLDGATWWGIVFPEPRASEEYREKVDAA